MMNGLRGAMGLEIAAAVLRRDGMTLAPFALSGSEGRSELTVDDGAGGSPVTVQLYGPDCRDEAAARAKSDFPVDGSLVCVDFTLPDAVNENAEWYTAHKLPFVMGTTGGDRDQMMSLLDAQKTYCVIAPNMAKQIVALQASLEQMAADFPGKTCFNPPQLSITPPPADGGRLPGSKNCPPPPPSTSLPPPPRRPILTHSVSLGLPTYQPTSSPSPPHPPDPDLPPAPDPPCPHLDSPGSFDGYTLRVVESHQTSKADT